VDEGARAVHGLALADLQDKPRFAEVADELLRFIDGAELIIHNASFDVGFLDAELARLGRNPPVLVGELCAVLDTLALAREMHPGQRNSLDALCKRYGIDNSHRELHGALLDARILADVYLAMTGGQSTLALDDAPRRAAVHQATATAAGELSLVVVAATPAERAAHEQLQELLQKESRGRCLWRSP
jgi:DNA polymerase-3 subunit epsilon